MFFFREFKHAFVLFIIMAIGLVALVVPLDQVLPPFFVDWVPPFLSNKSILLYLHEHIDFFLMIIPAVGLFTIILYLWRKR